ncbi:hypothetical protein [Legionella jamestowniensis]|uniref:Uncharacterized protein n=1 Tax=Legionella jamestowniensis TaxID=455 RepID=A0A0W0ULY1_9GAMM|nr:hypothetical protein [Legionella jamestowniensis]KTD08727.1 hypothetical protein Ljam_2922 [Legionella jamestowniensis]OCH96835.1 hypothetical protein A8135_04115 [Legionella jamestowniensis]SFL55624.1 hypothetical protein SAMN02746073_0873 [Legionella jamestowniensis DSM 19215]
MYRLNHPNRVTVYANPARDLMVIQGNSGVVYPFYKSSGHNSNSDQTWSPWMGYFEHHPLQKSDPSYNNQIYMVKPSPSTVSEEAQEIIKKYLGGNAGNFIQRMGNDEALALSCSLGGGDWDKYPLLRAEIMAAESTKKFMKPLEITDVTRVDFPPIPSSKDPIPFVGIKCSGDVAPSQAVLATSMETITANVASGYVTTFSVQDKKQFPTTTQVNNLMALKAERVVSASAVIDDPLPKTKVSAKQSPSSSPSIKQEAMLEHGRRIRERYLSKLGIVKDKYKSAEETYKKSNAGVDSEAGAEAGSQGKSFH